MYNNSIPFALSTKYNGQEYQDELGLNVTAMDYRQYDNAIGRFNCIDLLAEKNSYQSPYQFSNNSPIFFSDPTGLDASLSQILDDLLHLSGSGSTTWTNDGGGFWSTEGSSGGGGPGSGFYNSSNGGFTPYGSGASGGGAGGGGTGGGFSSGYVINNGSGNVLNELVLVRQPTKDANSGEVSFDKIGVFAFATDLKVAMIEAMPVFNKSIELGKGAEIYKTAFKKIGIAGDLAMIGYGGYNAYHQIKKKDLFQL